MNIDDMSRKRLKAIERKVNNKTNVPQLAVAISFRPVTFIRLRQAVLLLPFCIFGQEKYFDYLTLILQIEEILELLPHRFPFLLVDRVLDFEEGRFLRAVKNVSINEPFFRGGTSRANRFCGRADSGSDGAAAGISGV